MFMTHALQLKLSSRHLRCRLHVEVVVGKIKILLNQILKKRLGYKFSFFLKAWY